MKVEMDRQHDKLTLIISDEHEEKCDEYTKSAHAIVRSREQPTVRDRGIICVRQRRSKASIDHGSHGGETKRVRSNTTDTTGFRETAKIGQPVKTVEEGTITSTLLVLATQSHRFQGEFHRCCVENLFLGDAALVGRRISSRQIRPRPGLTLTLSLQIVSKQLITIASDPRRSRVEILSIPIMVDLVAYPVSNKDS